MTTTSGSSVLRSRRRQHIVIFAVVALAGFLILTPLDACIWKTLKVDNVPRLIERDIYQVFRQVGHLSVWAILAIASWMLWGHTRHRARNWFALGLAVITAPLVAGMCAELGKRLIGRLRPGIADDTGAYVFKPLFSAFADDSNLGIPSSHATVAFAGAFIITRLYPTLGPLALVMATGCALTRLLTGAHYATDVWAGACIAYAAADVVHRLLIVRPSMLAHPTPQLPPTPQP